MDVRIEPVSYQVTAYPGDDLNTYLFAITVEYAGHGKWAIRRLSSCLGTDGEWDYEPSPSNRADEWLDSHRFTLGRALALAEEHAPGITVNGQNVTQAWAYAKGSDGAS